MSTVLIVDDDKHACQLITINLKKCGYETVEAQTLQDGLTLLKKHQPHLLILDPKLADVSGWDMLREIDSDPTLGKVPVIIVTASFLEQANAYPYPHIVGWLTKPFEVADLVSTLRKRIVSTQTKDVSRSAKVHVLNVMQDATQL